MQLLQYGTQYGTLYAVWDASLSSGVLVMMQKLYHVAGVEGKPVVFLLTDTQISKESFLEDVNNLLNSGEVPGMYAPEDKEGIIGSIREWLLTQGAPTTKVFLQPLLLMHLYVNLLCCIFCCAVTSHGNTWFAACLLRHAFPHLLLTLSINTAFEVAVC